VGAPRTFKDVEEGKPFLNKQDQNDAGPPPPKGEDIVLLRGFQGKRVNDFVMTVVLKSMEMWTGDR